MNIICVALADFVNNEAIAVLNNNSIPAPILALIKGKSNRLNFSNGFNTVLHVH